MDSPDSDVVVVENIKKKRKILLKCPEGVDEDVFNSLPEELQQEIIAEEKGSSDVVNKNKRWSFLTYNVWFQEEIALTARMNEIGKICREENPDFIGFQEMTPNIVSLLVSQLAQVGYHFIFQKDCPYFVVLASRFKWVSSNVVEYPKSMMGRCLLYGTVEKDDGSQVLVGCTHLESPIPPFHGEAMMSLPRQQQLQNALEVLDSLDGEISCRVLMGDMNWNEGGRPYAGKRVGYTKIQDGSMAGFLHRTSNPWNDAWLSSDSNSLTFSESCTYNAKRNQMSQGSLMYRADRILYRCNTQTKSECKLVGTEPIAKVEYVNSKGKTLPVLPSDHFGLLCKLEVINEL